MSSLPSPIVSYVEFTYINLRIISPNRTKPGAISSSGFLASNFALIIATYTPLVATLCAAPTEQTKMSFFLPTCAPGMIICANSLLFVSAIGWLRKQMHRTACPVALTFYLGKYDGSPMNIFAVAISLSGLTPDA